MLQFLSTSITAIPSATWSFRWSDGSLENVDLLGPGIYRPSKEELIWVRIWAKYPRILKTNLLVAIGFGAVTIAVAVQQTRRKVSKFVRFPLNSCLMGMTVGLLLGTAVSALFNWFFSAAKVSGVVPIILSGNFMASTLAYFLGWSFVRASWRELKVEARALCQGCGYQLQGLPTDRCPECGRRANNRQSE